MGNQNSKWSDADAAAFCRNFAAYGEDLALRVYTTRLLGQDPTLVLHGGGNTSVKTTCKDELGRDVRVLCVKGSGWDMGSIEPEGLPAVELEPIRELRELDRLSDEAMVNGVRRRLLNSKSPTPSVETLLHAFLPAKFIDHTHADAILALADQERAEELCRELFGSRMGLVPYIMPGFLLSKKAAEVFEADPDVEGLILVNHGIFTFGETARSAYERMMDCIAAAQAYIDSHLPRTGFTAYSPATRAANLHPRSLAVLRGCLSSHEAGIGSQILHVRTSRQIEAYLGHCDLTSLASRGPATPDHVIRTKQKPLILPNPKLEDSEAFRVQVKTALNCFVREYREYFQTQSQAKGVTKTQVQPLPVVILVPGIGLITAGKTQKEAKIAADIYEHTIDTILKAEAVGRYRPLSDSHLFDMEYWSLEQAKLGKRSFKPMEGRVTLVTGACGGIGKAIAREFAHAGSNLVLCDLNEKTLADLAVELGKSFGTGVAFHTADLTREEEARALADFACGCFGGLDAVVSNAGKAFHGPIDEATSHLKASIDINLLSHQYLASAAVSVMKTQGLGGCLLFNASKSAFNPGPGFGAYSIPKAGLIALMKQFAVEFAGDGIRCSAVNADRVRTNLFDGELVAARAKSRGLEPDQYFRANLLGKEVLAEDVAKAFFHLYLSEKTTGAVMAVDGGNIAAAPR